MSDQHHTTRSRDSLGPTQFHFSTELRSFPIRTRHVTKLTRRNCGPSLPPGHDHGCYWRMILDESLSTIFCGWLKIHTNFTHTRTTGKLSPAWQGNKRGNYFNVLVPQALSLNLSWLLRDCVHSMSLPMLQCCMSWVLMVGPHWRSPAGHSQSGRNLTQTSQTQDSGHGAGRAAHTGPGHW